MADTPITLASGTPVANTASGVTVTLSGTQPAVGSVLTFQLIVTDDLGNASPPATCQVTIRALPTANIVGPGAVAVNTPITLDGSKSTASGGGTIKSYSWELTAVKAPVT